MSNAVAAKLFVSALDGETIETLKTDLIRRAGDGEDKPDPVTREGLAFLAFTEPDAELSEADIAEAMPVAEKLWTDEEKARMKDAI